MVGFLSLTYSDAVDAFNFSIVKNVAVESEWVQLFRAFFAVYGLGMTIGIVYIAGALPLASYTVTSWNLVTLRMLFAFIGRQLKSNILTAVASALRFPALVGSTVTVSVWWIILVPLIQSFMEKHEQRQKFWAFNTSFVLVNIHLLVLVFAGVEFLGSSLPLCFFDLWAGLFTAMIYFLFYLNVLDPAGLHFYIILTPRTGKLLGS